jgi:hypothetical protein
MSDDWEDAVIVFAESMMPDTSELAGPEKQMVRKEAAESRRKRLLDEVRNAGLEDELHVSEATPLRSIHVKGSPRALKACLDAPIVDEVLPISDEPSIEPLA